MRGEVKSSGVGVEMCTEASKKYIYNIVGRMFFFKNREHLSPVVKLRELCLNTVNNCGNTQCTSIVDSVP